MYFDVWVKWILVAIVVACIGGGLYYAVTLEQQRLLTESATAPKTETAKPAPKKIVGTAKSEYVGQEVFDSSYIPLGKVHSISDDKTEIYVITKGLFTKGTRMVFHAEVEGEFFLGVQLKITRSTFRARPDISTEQK